MFYQNEHFGTTEYFRKEIGTNFSYPVHLHRSFEFITVLEGQMSVSVADKSYELSHGEGILVFPGQVHSLKSELCHHMLIIFSPDLVSAYYSKRTSKLPLNNKIKFPSYLEGQLCELGNDSSVIKIKALLYSICTLLDEDTEYVERKNSESALIFSMFNFVENNYDKECTLRAMSNVLGYNEAYLSRCFVGATNMSFSTYVNHFKIGKACYILRNTNKSIIECAYESGYNTLRSFNRNFKNIIGLSPKEYRTQK